MNDNIALFSLVEPFRLSHRSIKRNKFVALSHNTIRGAAGGGILNAELLKAKGFLK